MSDATTQNAGKTICKREAPPAGLSESAPAPVQDCQAQTAAMLSNVERAGQLHKQGGCPAGCAESAQAKSGSASSDRRSAAMKSEKSSQKRNNTTRNHNLRIVLLFINHR